MSVTLLTACLFDKWGFDEGDILCPILKEMFPVWCHHDDDGDAGFYAGDDYFADSVLYLICEEFILPEIDPARNVDLKKVYTCHNPVRVWHIDGEEFTGNEKPDYILDIDPHHVVVEDSDIRAAAIHVHGLHPVLRPFYKGIGIYRQVFNCALCGEQPAVLHEKLKDPLVEDADPGITEWWQYKCPCGASGARFTDVYDAYNSWNKLMYRKDWDNPSTTDWERLCAQRGVGRMGFEKKEGE